MAAVAPDGHPAGRVAIVAGNGRIPVYVAEKLAEAGRNPFVIAIEGEADDDLLRFEHTFVHPTHVGVVLSALHRVKPAEVVMVGGVRSRPSLRRVRLDWPTLRVAARMLPKLWSGDDALLRSVVAVIEGAGYPVRGVHELVPDLLAEKGHLCGPSPSSSDMRTMAVAARGAFALGRLDAGQGCVAVGSRIVALEGAEGTDEMLRRVAALRREGRFGSRRGGVLVKLAKPEQELRTDLPTIGVTTIAEAADAGLAGVAVHAGKALIHDLEATRALAAQKGVFVVGIDPENPDSFGTGR